MQIINFYKKRKKEKKRRASEHARGHVFRG